MTPKPNPVYIMVPRKLIIAWVVSTSILFVGVLGNFQYTNYLSRQLCGLVSLSNDTYKKVPPPSETGRQMAKEFDRVSKKYHCK